MHCTSCGSLFPDAARFCASCGAPTSAAGPPNVIPPHVLPPQPPTSASSLGWIVRAVLVIAGLFLGLGWISSAVGSRSAPASASSSDYSAFADSVNQNMHEAMNGGLSDSCTLGKFKIKEMHGTTEYGILTVVGVVHNGCDEPAGVQLKLSQYDSKGSLVATDDQWPASVSNIGPHQDYEFKLMAEAPDSAVKYGVAPTDVRRW